MDEKKIESGEIIYHEGDVADVAYQLVSGKIELVEQSEGREVQVRIIEPGQIFGDLAVFDEKALRPVTSRTLEPCVVNVMSPEEFKRLLAECPKSIMPFLLAAFEKMKSTKFKAKPIAAALLSDITKITISPVSEKLKEQFKTIEVPLSRLPFRIGGYPEGGEVNRRDQLHLNIASITNPLRISRQHCEIIIDNKTIVVADLASRFCTKVNGNIIGRGHGIYVAPLHKGPNEIILSPTIDDCYKLSVNCE